MLICKCRSKDVTIDIMSISVHFICHYVDKFLRATRKTQLVEVFSVARLNKMIKNTYAIDNRGFSGCTVHQCAHI